MKPHTPIPTGVLESIAHTTPRFRPPARYRFRSVATGAGAALLILFLLAIASRTWS